MLDRVTQVSFGGRHCLLLFKDGHVEAQLTSGRRADQGQCRVDDWKEITYVEAGANCSYGVRKDGNVLVSGIPPVPSESIVEMKHVKAVAEGDSFVICLMATGQLKMLISAGASQELKNMKTAVEMCQIVLSVDVSRGCVVALDRNKGVHCYCVEDGDPRQKAETWTDIVAIAADSHYVAGLTAKGTIRLAGRESVMDGGRKDAIAWKNNIALACAPSGIGAIALDGTLHMAGNIIGAETLESTYKPFAQQIAAAIIQQ